MVCVCVPKPDEKNEAALSEALINAVVSDMGKSYKPKKIVFVQDLPKTRTMKVMRRVVKAVLLGKEPGDLSSMVNPESLVFLRQKRLT